jgi:hypothetical protein
MQCTKLQMHKSNKITNSSLLLRLLLLLSLMHLLPWLTINHHHGLLDLLLLGTIIHYLV